MEQQCPCDQANKHVLADPVNGRYCSKCAQFDEAAFEAHWHPAYFPMFSFIHRFMRRNLADAQIDYLANKIASEIWIHNMGRLLAEDGKYARHAGQLEKDACRSQLLRKCNTYSIAQYLGIPQETARRKIRQLIERGWVLKESDGSLIISAACEAEFKQEFITETMRDFVSTARAVFALLDIEVKPEPPPASPPPDPR